MVLQPTYVGTSAGLSGADSVAVQISLMAVLVLGAVVLALLGSFAVLILVPLAAVVVRKRHEKRTQASTAPAEPEVSDPLRGTGPRHTNSPRNT